MSEPYSIFLDDVRSPDYVEHVPEAQYRPNWVIVRSYKEFVDTITNKGIPAFISYDHDLCMDAVREFIRASDQQREFNYYRKPMEKTGLDCAKWLVIYCLQNQCRHPEYFIHSSNGIGAKNIKNLIESTYHITSL